MRSDMRKAAVLIIFAFAVLAFVGTVVLQSVLILQRVAAVRDVQGQVSVQARGKDDFQPLAGRERVYAGDTVKTGENGHITLEWLDGTRLVVGPKTLMTVLKCQINTATDAEMSIFKLDAGSIWIRVIKVLSHKSKFEIVTPTATAGVRGTIFSVRVASEGETKISVLEGQVAVSSSGQGEQVAQNTVATVTGDRTDIQNFDEQERLTWNGLRNVAEPILRIKAPPGGYQAKPGETVAIEGQSEKGASVTVNGQPVELQIKQRFSADVMVPGDFAEPEMTVTVKAVDARGYEALREAQVKVVR